MSKRIKLTNELELRFIKWLKHKNYPYLYIDQSIQTFSSLFKNMTKRPDFLVVLPSIGLISVDVKKGNYSAEYDSFALDEKDEIMKLSSFEYLFRIPVWISFANTRFDFGTMYWISLNDIRNAPLKYNYNRGDAFRSYNRGDAFRSYKRGDAFRSIPLRSCTTIGWDDGLGKIIKPYNNNHNNAQ